MMKQSLSFRSMVAAGLLTASVAASAGSVFGSGSYNASTTFADALTSTTMTIAFDGSSYWSTSGGSSDGVRLAQYDASGSTVAGYSPGLDFRSVFTDAGGTVLARQYNDSTIYKQTAPGVFSSLLTLDGGVLDAQSSVVKDGSNYLAKVGGTVSQWDASGNFIGAVSLTGFGSVGGEGAYPQDRGIAVAGNYWLTYDSGLLSAWDHSGNRLDSTTLNGATGTFDANFSLSYANNKVFVVSQSGGTWNGYDVGITAAVPEPESYALMLAGLCAVSMIARRRKAVDA